MKADIEHDEYPDCCRCCGAVFPTRDGQEPTTYCDQCAHILVEELRAFKRGVTKWLADRQLIRYGWHATKNMHGYFFCGPDQLSQWAGETMEEALQKLGRR
ncbi:MAG: hypothetical protein FJ276_19310 [Planctomycetes bacterium]|nr:hypothetical protein [Planctomycetota bacterium]